MKFVVIGVKNENIFSPDKKLGIRNCVGRSTGSMVTNSWDNITETATAAVRHRRPLAT